MNNNTISVIVPIFNIRQYLHECINSIINQTYTDLQIILVDDGSTDGSEEVCDEFASEDNRIEVIHKVNGGLVSARKAGLLQAKGEFVGFVDGDDFINKYMFELLIDEIKRTNVEFVHAGYLYGENSISVLEREVVKIEDKREQLLQSTLKMEGKYLSPSIWSKLFKASVIKEAYSKVNDANSYGEDLICLFYLMFICKTMATIDRPLYYYRRRNDSIIRKKDIRTLADMASMAEVLRHILIENGLYNVYWKDLIDERLAKNIFDKVISLGSYFQYAKHEFPHPELLLKKRIIIYGAGAVGRDYYSQFCRYENFEIVAWVDKKPAQYNYKYITIRNANQITEIEADYIVVAVANQRMADSIITEILTYGIDRKRIIWEEPLKMGIV